MAQAHPTEGQKQLQACLTSEYAKGTIEQMQILQKNIGTFIRYILCGFGALAIDLGLYYTLLYLDVWYIAASITSGVAGFISAFLLHKYIAFQVRSNGPRQFIRYCLLGAFNLVMTNIILYVTVSGMDIPPEIAKLIANGAVVAWNFFFYKFVVYR